jgi:hypothetical protein
MSRLNPLLNTFIADESGQDMLELAVAAGLIGASACLAMKSLRVDIANAAISIWNAVVHDS